MVKDWAPPELDFSSPLISGARMPADQMMVWTREWDIEYSGRLKAFESSFSESDWLKTKSVFSWTTLWEKICLSLQLIFELFENWISGKNFFRICNSINAGHNSVI
jgi:hypothetical protein